MISENNNSLIAHSTTITVALNWTFFFENLVRILDAVSSGECKTMQIASILEFQFFWKVKIREEIIIIFAQKYKINKIAISFRNYIMIRH